MYVGMILLVAWNYLRQLTHALSNKLLGAVLALPPQLGDLQRLWHECIMYHDITDTAGLARGSLGEQSQTEPSRSIRPDMMVLVLMPSFNFRHAFRNDN